MSEIDYTKTQLIVFFVILLLAVDSINPVKMFLHVFPQVQPWHIASVSIMVIVYVFISEMKPILYFSTKIFFHSILSIFFRDVQIVGKDNIPVHGPVIFTSNHANQFIDSLAVMCTCQRTLSYIVAEKSWNRNIVGHLAWAIGAVPVKRAQDSAVAGTGKITLIKKEDLPKDETGVDENQNPVIKVVGSGTRFLSELNVADKIRLSGSAFGLKITKIDTDYVLYVRDPEDPAMVSYPDSAVKFDILKYVDHKVVFEKVLDKLASNGTIGIFPEGGSHDRTDLLPLKVGVALIAYSALDKDGLSIPIVPVGLNYFRAHRFRGRAIVEFGSPSYLDPSTLGAYQTGGTERRKACNDLIKRIEDGMRSVIVSVPDYETLQLIHTARRLVQRRESTASEKQDMNRRFAEGYKQILLRTEGNLPEDWIKLRDRMVAYQKELSDLGIRDYQVIGLDRELKDKDSADSVLREMRLPYRFAHLITVWGLALFPAILLNLPIGLLARLYAEQRRKKALANSKVKIKGYDVMLSEKVIFCIAMVPTLWFTYGLILYFCSDLDGPALTLSILSMPLFSFIGVIAAEAGMIDAKAIRPYYMRIFPSNRQRLAALPAVRKELQSNLRAFIKEIGPTLGEIYSGKELDWKRIQRDSVAWEEINHTPTQKNKKA